MSYSPFRLLQENLFISTMDLSSVDLKIKTPGGEDQVMQTQNEKHAPVEQLDPHHRL